jgi:phosphoribosylaminoimidazole carboxylase
VASLEGAGIFGVELFELPDGRVVLNEIAPRPHNSGHFTIEACETSQFEAHIRAILDMPLGSTDLQVGCSLMINILGTGNAAETKALIDRAAGVPGATLHWYGKAADKMGRKMAHITLVASNMAALRQRALLLGQENAINMLKHVAGATIGIIMGSDSDLPTMRAAAEVLDGLEVGDGGNEM